MRSSTFLAAIFMTVLIAAMFSRESTAEKIPYDMDGVVTHVNVHVVHTPYGTARSSAHNTEVEVNVDGYNVYANVPMALDVNVGDEVTLGYRLIIYEDGSKKHTSDYIDINGTRYSCELYMDRNAVDGGSIYE